MKNASAAGGRQRFLCFFFIFLASRFLCFSPMRGLVLSLVLINC